MTCFFLHIMLSVSRIRICFICIHSHVCEGRDRKNVTKLRCQVTPGRYSCRCECFNANLGCSAACQCYKCCNNHGKQPRAKPGDSKVPRKRAKHDAQVASHSTLSFMQSRDEMPKFGSWSDLEHCLFVQVLHYLRDESLPLSVDFLHHLYNSIVPFASTNPDLPALGIATRNNQEMGAKYAHHCKEGGLIGKFLSSQNVSSDPN